MIFEIHVTVETADIDSFKHDCELLGVKPIVIETERNGEFKQQVMTSQKYNHRNPKRIASVLVDDMKDLVYNPIRVKIEKYPEMEKDENFIYYETHMRLKVHKGFDRSELVDLCKAKEFHLSKNLFKRNDEFDYQMITYRDMEATLFEFKDRIVDMKTALDNLKIEYDKLEIEECIHDTNINVDNDWLN